MNLDNPGWEPYRVVMDIRRPVIPGAAREAMERHIRACVLRGAELEEQATREYLMDLAHQGLRALLALTGQDPGVPEVSRAVLRVAAGFLESVERGSDPVELLARVFAGETEKGPG